MLGFKCHTHTVSRVCHACYHTRALHVKMPFYHIGDNANGSFPTLKILNRNHEQSSGFMSNIDTYMLIKLELHPHVQNYPPLNFINVSKEFT